MPIFIEQDKRIESLAGALECRAPSKPRCRWLLRPPTVDQRDVADAEVMRGQHEWRKHHYRNSVVRKIRRADLLPPRPHCANPDCRGTIGPDAPKSSPYCTNCRQLFARFPAKRPRGRVRCMVCATVFTVEVRKTPGRYPTTCTECRARLSRAVA